ncbi:hypothetical protein BBH99_12355 [Chryseobacterium contaminans]|uniref:Uncharacterized protein n=2 Tax=Chryseobacterium contaminans TaxID=1423959 RepID=A0A1M7EQC8_9FLAO|nr:hypothetical protein [Chryseobacterium contaminans]OCA76565.1 hypothetical protein BBH99_12355 [Chryseobacterium contaminans]SHL93793.1 hypothetical protein SAMN05444407_107277 [Chryseobacterium contaminans]
MTHPFVFNDNILFFKLAKTKLRMKKPSIFFISVIILAFMAAIFYIFWGNPFSAHSELDIPDKPNEKLFGMFNKEIEKEIENHTQSVMYPGYIAESRQNTINYLKTIKTIESSTRYGVKSTQPRNNLELRIVFKDGNVAEKIYTGHSCSGYTSPCLLMKVEMKDGKATHIFTNGVERKGSPEWIIPDLNIMINKAISYDINRNPNQYFPPQKTQQDFDKEWNE